MLSLDPSTADTALLLYAEADGDQPVVFYYIDPGFAMERLAGKTKFRNKFYYQYQRQESWTHPGMRAFGRVNGGLTFQGFQKVAGNAVPLSHVFFSDKAGCGHLTHHPIFGTNIFTLLHTAFPVHTIHTKLTIQIFVSRFPPEHQ